MGAEKRYGLLCLGKGYETYDPLFEQYVNGPEEMTGLVYDDVVVAIKGLKTKRGGKHLTDHSDR